MGDEGRSDLPWWLLTVAVKALVGPFLLVLLACLFMLTVA